MQQLGFIGLSDQKSKIKHMLVIVDDYYENYDAADENTDNEK